MDFYLKYYFHYPFTERKKYANNILKAAGNEKRQPENQYCGF